MVRVLPLFTHLMLRGERVTVFGRDKVLDFTYVDDAWPGSRAASLLLPRAACATKRSICYGLPYLVFRFSNVYGRSVPIVFSSTREVYGDVHRFEGYGEATADFA